MFSGTTLEESVLSSAVSSVFFSEVLMILLTVSAEYVSGAFGNDALANARNPDSIPNSRYVYHGCQSRSQMPWSVRKSVWNKSPTKPAAMATETNREAIFPGILRKLCQ